MSTRGERVYDLLKDAGSTGMTTDELNRATRLMDISKGVESARKEWCGKNEMIVTKMEKHSFFGFFERKQARYILQRMP